MGGRPGSGVNPPGLGPPGRMAVEAVAGVHRANVDRKLADLAALPRELADLVDRCSRGRVATCWIIEALSLGR